jgi:molybdopterin-containing oxidoreductase family membrane subunit
MDPERYIMGIFKNEDRVVETIAALKNSPYTFKRVNSPVPSHKIMDALGLKKSAVGWFTLVGGIVGFCCGFALAIFCSVQWDLIVSGKPIISLIPFVIVGFEFTILFSVFGNVIGLLTQARLPSFKWLKHYDPRCSGEHFGILASCETSQMDGLKDFFQNSGADVRVFDKRLSEDGSGDSAINPQYSI